VRAFFYSERQRQLRWQCSLADTPGVNGIINSRRLDLPLTYSPLVVLVYFLVVRSFVELEMPELLLWRSLRSFPSHGSDRAPSVLPDTVYDRLCPMSPGPVLFQWTAFNLSSQLLQI